MIRFPAGGHQSILIQTREDGVSIDQVVLSRREARAGEERHDDPAGRVVGAIAAAVGAFGA
jgi:hypothetical protein